MMQCLACLGLLTNIMPPSSHEPYEPVVYIDQEPSHKTVFINEVLRIFDVTIEPQARSLFHLHNKDSVMVCLKGADVPSEEPGKAVIQRPALGSGQIYFRAYSQAPFVHRIQNMSAHRFRILDIEVLSEPATQGRPALELAPAKLSAIIALENDRVRVSKFILHSDERLHAITFRGPHLFVFMLSGKVGIESPTDAATPIDVQSGQFHYIAQAQNESIYNFGGEAIEILMLEIK